MTELEKVHYTTKARTAGALILCSRLLVALFAAVVKDATAAPRHPNLGDGYKAALINYGYITSAVLFTDEVVEAMA